MSAHFYQCKNNGCGFISKDQSPDIYGYLRMDDDINGLICACLNFSYECYTVLPRMMPGVYENILSLIGDTILGSMSRTLPDLFKDKYER